MYRSTNGQITRLGGPRSSLCFASVAEERFRLIDVHTYTYRYLYIEV